MCKRATKTQPAWPSEIRLASDRRSLTIRWDDGTDQVLTAEYLRVESPSAEVQGHGPSEKKTVPGKANVEILQVEPVGHYAVRLVFDDGIVATDAESYLQRIPAQQNFEALETSSIVALPRAVLNAGYDQDHAIERFGRLMLEEALIGSQRRVSRLLVLQPEERYRIFVETRPEVARRVPQYLIASYLGLTPESLSRIRRRIAVRPR